MPLPAARRVRDVIGSTVLAPRALVFVPALVLAASWALGEGALLAAAVALPFLYIIGDPRARPRAITVRDGITQLPLRAALVEAVDEAFLTAPRSGRTTSVFAVAIDDADHLEQQYGLHLAEEVLRRTADRIALVLRGGDLLVRLDGPVFGIALSPIERVDLETAIQTAARIQDAVRAPLMIDGARVNVTVSVGFCLARRAPRPTGEAALAAAQDALAEAQLTGAGAIRAFSRDRVKPASVHTDTADVLRALEGGQIRPWYQPQIDTDTGDISGFEALVRWEHPERGPLGPGEFLPVLAEAGQLERLGEVVLFHGLSALRSWDRADLSVPSLGINFSPEELRNPRLSERLAWELDRFDLAAGRLTVEILETVVADAKDDSIARTIASLARLGCRIDLDDFGTGNASLTALRRFAISRIKIDRSFVTNVDEDQEQQKMIAGIIGLAERLGVDTLAEGVERVGEHAILAQLGCGHVQGFGVARPMPFEETAGWLKQHRARLAKAPDWVRRAV